MCQGLAYTTYRYYFIHFNPHDSAMMEVSLVIFTDDKTVAQLS